MGTFHGNQSVVVATITKIKNTVATSTITVVQVSKNRSIQRSLFLYESVFICAICFCRVHFVIAPY